MGGGGEGGGGEGGGGGRWVGGWRGLEGVVRGISVGRSRRNRCRERKRRIRARPPSSQCHRRTSARVVALVESPAVAVACWSDDVRSAALESQARAWPAVAAAQLERRVEAPDEEQREDDALGE